MLERVVHRQRFEADRALLRVESAIAQVAADAKGSWKARIAEVVFWPVRQVKQ